MFYISYIMYLILFRVEERSGGSYRPPDVSIKRTCHAIFLAKEVYIFCDRDKSENKNKSDIKKKI